jgi:hypothetical protein
MLRSMGEAPEEPLVKKVVKWFVEKIADHWLELLLGGGVGLAGVFALISRTRRFFVTYLWNLRLPFLFFILFLVPAIFGIYVFVRRRCRTLLHVTLDPQLSSCYEVQVGPPPRTIQLTLVGVFANNSPDIEFLLLYAYIKGTNCLSHFSKPLGIGPGTALLQKHVQSVCTLPPGRPRHTKRHYKATVYFVDASGRKFRQRVKIDYTVMPAPAKPEPSLENPWAEPPD